MSASPSTPGSAPDRNDDTTPFAILFDSRQKTVATYVNHACVLTITVTPATGQLSDATTDVPRPVRISVTRHEHESSVSTVDPLWGKFDVDTLRSVLDDLDAHGLSFSRMSGGETSKGLGEALHAYRRVAAAAALDAQVAQLRAKFVAEWG